LAQGAWEEGQKVAKALLSRKPGESPNHENDAHSQVLIS